MTPNCLKTMLNWYGPYLGAGIGVESISPDWRQLRVSLKLRWYNRNAVGTHFGGSLYSMVDPHYMLMLMAILGKGYIVWDKAASIDFVRAEKTTVHAEFHITDEDLDTILKKTEQGDKYLHTFHLAIKNDAEDVIATVEKVVYVRKKKHLHQ